jgi:hypothetical protein
MKNRTRLLLIWIVLVPVLGRAEPFWCPPGTDRVNNHPLSFESLKPDLDEIELEVNKLIYVRQALRRHIGSLDSQADSASVEAFYELLARILSREDMSQFLSTSFFDFDNLFNFGVAKEPCGATPDSVLRNRPALYSVYEAAEAVMLVGRSISLASHSDIAEFLSSNYSAYEAWLITDGLPQWPWELWLNGKMVSNDILEPPPLKQWIFARPSVGIDLSYPNQENADAVPSFALEVLGFVKYRDRSYRKHVGVSVLATIGSEEGAGYGLALRWNGFWAGYVVKQGDRADAVYLGFDLAKVLRDDEERKSLADEFAEELVPLIRGSLDAGN